MMFNAAGWRGVHALDAIAHGDGPNTFADLATQEFQWSRSLVTILLKYTPLYIGKLSPRLEIPVLVCPALVSDLCIVHGCQLPAANYRSNLSHRVR